jgi:hypothetical protein
METIEVFEYDDLSPTAQARAREYASPPDDWADCTTECFKEDGYLRGFHMYESNWNVGHSQGDGASWTGIVKTAEFLEAHINEVKDADRHSRYTILLEILKHARDTIPEKVEITRRSFFYNHSGTMNAEYLDTFYDEEEINDDELVRGGILEGACVQELMRAINTNNLQTEFLEWIQDKAREYADDMFHALQREYDEYYSEEYIKDLIHINGWRFNSEGVIQDGV